MGEGGRGRIGGGVWVDVNEELKLFGKLKKNGGGSGWGVGLWGQGGCERRIEAFGKIHKKKSGGRVGSGWM